MSRHTKTDIKDARERLIALMERARKDHNGKPEVQCTLHHVSRSGMSREIGLSVLIIDADGQPDSVDISGLASVLCGNSTGKRGGVRIGGCGMDMGFALVYNLSHHLYYGTRPGDAGYALQHRWL